MRNPRLHSSCSLGSAKLRCTNRVCLWPFLSFCCRVITTAKRATTRGTCWKNGGDPGGIRTRDLDLERVASLARLDDGVRRSATRAKHGHHSRPVGASLPAGAAAWQGSHYWEKVNGRRSRPSRSEASSR